VNDVYFSADVEADGPIPGEYSMLSFGFAVAGRFDGKSFDECDPSEATFYRELKPITDQVDPEALAVAGLDRTKLARDGTEPSDAMRAAATWVSAYAAGARPVLVAYPLGFDWMFLHWYFIRFLGSSPFGFSSALDIKTIYQQKARVTLDHAGLKDLPVELSPKREHTHNALDDAVEQAEILQRLLLWDGT
jgi:DNA polymerase III epsilon subunit-like protein